jgi:hypothetical protein
MSFIQASWSLRVADKDRSILKHSLGVMAGLFRPSTSFLLKARKEDVDARDDPRMKSGDGHDAGEVIPSHRNAL